MDTPRVKWGEKLEAGMAAVSFHMSHGRKVEISESLGPIDIMILLSQGIIAISHSSDNAREGLQKFARMLEAGALEQTLNSLLSVEDNPKPIVHVIDVIGTHEEAQSARITIRFDRGGQKSDAWVAMAEAIAHTAMAIRKDPASLLLHLADNLPDGIVASEVACDNAEAHPIPKIEPMPKGWTEPPNSFSTKGGAA